MLIRSQDKMNIVNVDNTDSIIISRMKEGWEINAFNGPREFNIWLGDYSTKEKAIKVLDMIIEKYGERITIMKGETIVNVIDIPKLYEMPQDEEV